MVWIVFYCELCGLLHSGDVVCVDLLDDGVLLYGVVVFDCSEVVFVYVWFIMLFDVYLGLVCLFGFDLWWIYVVWVWNEIGVLVIV